MSKVFVIQYLDIYGTEKLKKYSKTLFSDISNTVDMSKKKSLNNLFLKVFYPSYLKNMDISTFLFQDNEVGLYMVKVCFNSKNEAILMVLFHN